MIIRLGVSTAYEPAPPPTILSSLDHSFLDPPPPSHRCIYVPALFLLGFPSRKNFFLFPETGPFPSPPWIFQYLCRESSFGPKELFPLV